MRKGIVRQLFNNLGYKIFALFLAVMIWSMVQGEQVLEENREIKVTLDIPDGYTIRGDTERVAVATIKGPRVLMLEAPKNLEARIRVPALRGGTVRIHLDKSDIRDWGDRLQINILDSYITVFVDEKATRVVPVKYVPHGTPADGFMVKKALLSPRSVRITGPKEDLMKVREVFTEPVDIDGLQSNKSFEVTIIPPSDFKRDQIVPQIVSVSVQVDETLENKRFDRIPIEVLGSEFEATCRPIFSSVVIQAVPSVLKFVRSEDLKAFIEIRDMPPGQYEREVRVKIPNNTVLIESTPQKVTVDVGRKRR